MRASVMTAMGGPEVLEYREVATPRIITPTDVLVRIHAAGVNPVDAKLRQAKGAYPLNLPAVLGCDGAGTIEAVGREVARFNPGDAVFFYYAAFGARLGSYAEHAVVDERFLVKKPASVSFEEAAAAPLVLITAWESLFDRARLESGQLVLVHAGAGGVGHVAVQLAKHAGARVCTTVGSPEKAEFVVGLGANEPILYKEEDFNLVVLEWSDEQGVDVALDSVGGKTFEHSFTAVRCFGDLVTLLQPRPDTNWLVARQRNLRISLELMLTPVYLGMEDAQRHQTAILERCAQLLGEGKLKVHVSDVLDLGDAAEAHRRIEQGGTTGKLVLRVD